MRLALCSRRHTDLVWTPAQEAELPELRERAPAILTKFKGQ